MLYDSFHIPSDTVRTEWLPSGIMRNGVSHRIFVDCLTVSAQRVEQWVVRDLKAKGASVGVSSAPAASKDGSRLRMVFTVHGTGTVRGAIAGLVNLLGADAAVRAVRWESDPRSA
jgi:hypothetical protein